MYINNTKTTLSLIGIFPFNVLQNAKIHIYKKEKSRITASKRTAYLVLTLKLKDMFD